MPNEKIAETFVDNGPDMSYTNSLRLKWGAYGAVPEAQEGWVNQGYVHLLVSWDKGHREETHYVELDEAGLDHLIRKLKHIRRRAFDARNSSERG